MLRCAVFVSIVVHRTGTEGPYEQIERATESLKVRLFVVESSLAESPEGQELMHSVGPGTLGVRGVIEASGVSVFGPARYTKDSVASIDGSDGVNVAIERAAADQLDRTTWGWHDFDDPSCGRVLEATLLLMLCFVWSKREVHAKRVGRRRTGC